MFKILLTWKDAELNALSHGASLELQSRTVRPENAKVLQKRNNVLALPAETVL